MLNPRSVDFYIRMSFEGLQLLVTQRDVFSIEVVDDVQLFTAEEAAEIAEIKEEGAGSIGWIVVGESQFLVYVLSGRMERLSYIPKKREYCLIMQSEQGGAGYGLLCEEVEALPRHYELALQAMPEVVHMSYSPFSALGLYENQVACVTSAELLFRYMTAGGEEQDAPLRQTIYGDETRGEDS